MVLHQLDRSQPHQQLAQQMRHAGRRLAPADIDHPLAKDRRIDEGIAPEQVAKTRMVAHQAAQVVMLDEGELARDQRAQAVIHHAQVQALEIGDVAADVERQDLPLALGGDVVAAGEALDDKAALGGGVALPDDVLVGRDGFQPQRQALAGRPSPPARAGRCSPACGSARRFGGGWHPRQPPWMIRRERMSLSRQRPRPPAGDP